MEEMEDNTVSNMQWEIENTSIRLERNKAEQMDGTFVAAFKQLGWRREILRNKEMMDRNITQNNERTKASNERSVKHHFPVNKTLLNLRLLNLKLMHYNYQDNLHNPPTEPLNLYATRADSYGNSQLHGMFNEDTPIGHGAGAEDERERDLSLMKLLAQCHLKLEELEELKHSSDQLARELCDARESIAYLRQTAEELETENSQKEGEINVLSIELTESKSLLREKSYEMAHVKMLVRTLSKQLRKKQRQIANKSHSDAKCRTSECHDVRHLVGEPSQSHEDTSFPSKENSEPHNYISGQVVESPEVPGTNKSIKSNICTLL